MLGMERKDAEGQGWGAVSSRQAVRDEDIRKQKSGNPQRASGGYRED